MRALLIAFVVWVRAQFTRFNGCLAVLGVVTILGYLVWGVIFGLQWGGFITPAQPTAEPTATATAEPTATSTAEPIATKAAAAKPKPTKAKAAAPVPPTAVPTAEPPSPPAPTPLTGDEGPCKGGTNNTHFVETREGVGNSGWMEYDITLQKGEVGLAWGSQIPGFGDGRSFVTIAGPWTGKVGIFNGAYRQGKVLTDLAQTQAFWGDIIDCDLQRALPVADQKRGLYQQFRVNW